MGRIRRLGLTATFAVTAALIGAAVHSATDDSVPAPVVWRDHVVDPAMTNTR
jgi:hypothetical protein